MIGNTWKLALAMGLGGLIWGCQAPPQREEPTATRISVASPEERDLLWETTAEVLREQFFDLDRQDRQAGVFSTDPETAAAFFEFWRPQSSNSYFWAEDNLHTIQRRAVVELTPVEEPDEYDLNVRVDRFRYRLTERQITNAAAAMRLYSSAAPTYSGELGTPEETSYWIPLGRDPVMEDKLLFLIVSRFRADAAWPVTQPAADEAEDAVGSASGSQPPAAGLDVSAAVAR